MNHSPYLNQDRDLDTLEQLVRDYEAEAKSDEQSILSSIQARGGNVRVLVSPALMSRAS